MCGTRAFRIYSILLGFINALISAGVVVVAIIWISTEKDLFSSEDKTSRWLGIPHVSIDIIYMISHMLYFFGNVCLVIESYYEGSSMMVPIVFLGINNIVQSILFTIQSSQDLIIAAGYSGFICFSIIITCCFHFKVDY